MSLSKCIECGHEISNGAAACLHCGYPLTGKSSLPGDDVKLQLNPEQKVLKKLVWICVGLFCTLVAIISVVVITNPSAAKEAKDFLEKLKQNPPKLVE
jgi:uncharacterized membrane protein YvbJ